jgi:DNA primase
MRILIAHRKEHLEFPHTLIKIELFGKVKPTGLDKLKVTMKFSREEDSYPYRKSIDLYHHDQTENLIREVADHFVLPITEVRKCIGQLTNELEGYRIDMIDDKIVSAKILSPEEKKQAEKYLSSPDLMKRIQQDIGKTGIVGEEINRLLAYVAATSRKLHNPLHLYSMGSTGTGKTYLQNKIASLIPSEDKIQLTSLTDASLYYFTKEELDGKLLCIEDLGLVSQDGLYMIRELQTSKRLTRTLVDKSESGESRAVRKTVVATIGVFATTTKVALYEDNVNRVLVINPDTSITQQQAISEYMKLKAAGKINEDEEERYKLLLQDIQRVLVPIKVINPFATSLTLPATITSPLRTMNIYLGLIEAITFLNQYSRDVKTGKDGSKYIESTTEDIEWANKLFLDTLLAKSDDLSPAVRSFLEELKKRIGKSESFTVKELKPNFNISTATIVRYLRELLHKEYISANGNRYKGLQYELREDQDYDRIKSELKGFWQNEGVNQ